MKKEIKQVKTNHVIHMIECVVSACIQKGYDSVSIKEIKQFYEHDNFDECFKEVLPYLTTHGYHNLKQHTTYSLNLRRKRFDGTIGHGHSVRSAIKKSDYSF